MKIFSTTQNSKDVLNKMNTLSQMEIKVGDLVRINSSDVVAEVSSIYHSARDNCKMLTLHECRKNGVFLYGTVSEKAVTKISDTVVFN
jgi:hypothetical protein